MDRLEGAYANQIAEKAKLLERLYKKYNESVPSGFGISYEESRLIDGREYFFTANGYTTGMFLPLVKVRSVGLEDSSFLFNASTLENLLKKLGIANTAAKIQPLIAFLDECMLRVQDQIESGFKTAGATLSERERILSDRVRHRVEDLERTQEYEDERISHIRELTRKMEEAERKASDEFQRLLNVRDKLYGLQRIVEQEARNLYNTRTFIAGSGTIKSIRERLMSAISEVALGTWSIYHDHKPPADLMPVSGVLPPDIKRLKELGVRTPGENSTKQ